MKLTKKEVKLLKELINDWRVLCDSVDAHPYCEPTPEHLREFADSLSEKLKK